MGIEKPFDMSLTPEVSQNCQQESKEFINSLKNFELWALKSMCRNFKPKQNEMRFFNY